MSPSSAPPSFFPVDVASKAEFIAIYVVLGVMGLAVGKLLATLVASALDRAPVAPSPHARPSADDHQRLTEGFLPKPDEAPSVGYLKSGSAGFAAAIVADALASGWLYHVPGTKRGARGSYALGRQPRDTGALARELAVELSKRGPLDPRAVRESALSIAEKHSAVTERALFDAGLLRGAGERVAASLAMWVVTSAVLAVGVLRCVRDRALGGSALPALAATLAIFGAAVAFSGVPRRTDRGQRYVEWLERSTSALRARVSEGAEPSVADTALAAALVGLGAGPELAGLAPPNERARASVFD